MKQPQFKNKDALSRSTPNVGRENRRRAAILGMILFFTLLWTQTSSAENPLLRGPRKVVRSNADAPKPASMDIEKQYKSRILPGEPVALNPGTQ